MLYELMVVSHRCSLMFLEKELSRHTLRSSPLEAPRTFQLVLGGDQEPKRLRVLDTALLSFLKNAL